MKAHVEDFIAKRWAIARRMLRIQLQPMTGGLESSVVLATVDFSDSAADAPRRLVVKQLPAGSDRRADVYELLATRLAPLLSGEVFGVHTVGDTRYVYLEELQPCSAWPWSDTSTAAAVCRVLAHFHQSADLPQETFTWDYETELRASAEATLDIARTARAAIGVRYWRRLGELRTVVEALPEMRSRLLARGTTVIHGDVHPGNVILRAHLPKTDLALIDWDRARIGSPLEDVASWLHSLGCWEPEARRRHDTLLRAYVGSRGWTLTPELRKHYWFASVSNGLSGAIRYHLAVLADPKSSDADRVRSATALPAWQRVIRRGATLVKATRQRCS